MDVRGRKARLLGHLAPLLRLPELRDSFELSPLVATAASNRAIPGGVDGRVDDGERRFDTCAIGAGRCVGYHVSVGYHAGMGYHVGVRYH
jgi:hypothetical protein